MENKEKVFVSTQLLAVLHPIALKTLLFICNWQNSPNGIMLYEHRFARTLKLTDEEVKLAIQTLINLKLINLVRVDDKWKIELKKSTFDKYLKIPMDRVIEHEGYKLATEITYDTVETETPNGFDNMSTEQLQRMILMMQAQLNEKKQVESMVKAASMPTDDNDGLPF